MAKQAALICGNDEYLVTSNAREWVDAVCPTDEQALGWSWLKERRRRSMRRCMR